MPQHRDPTVQLVDERKFGKVCVEVLAHRLKNKIATAMIRSSVPIMRAGDQHSQLRLAANIVPGISLRVVARSLSVYVESKTDLFVKRSSYRIVTIQMQKKHLGASDDLADECTNQRGCINTLAVTWVSTHGRNLLRARTRPQSGCRTRSHRDRFGRRCTFRRHGARLQRLRSVAAGFSQARSSE